MVQDDIFGFGELSVGLIRFDITTTNIYYILKKKPWFIDFIVFDWLNGGGGGDIVVAMYIIWHAVVYPLSIISFNGWYG